VVCLASEYLILKTNITMALLKNTRRWFLKNTVLGAALASTPSLLRAENAAPKKLQTQLTKAYGFEVPIISAGMAFVATADLPIAVSKAGGLGVMSGSGLPPDYLKAQIQKMKMALGNKPFGVNFIPRFIQIDHIEACIIEKVPVVVFFWDDVPPQYLSRLKANNIKIWVQIGSYAEAQAAVKAGFDAIIVQGLEAGGHNKSSASLFSLLPNIVKAVAPIPVIASARIQSWLGWLSRGGHRQRPVVAVQPSAGSCGGIGTLVAAGLCRSASPFASNRRQPTGSTSRCTVCPTATACSGAARSCTS
jgi:hypothetical protein